MWLVSAVTLNGMCASVSPRAFPSTTLTQNWQRCSIGGGCGSSNDLGAEPGEDIEVPKVALMDDLHMILMKCDAADHVRQACCAPAPTSSPSRRSAYFKKGFLIPATRYLEAISLRGPLLKEYIETVFGRVDVLFGPVLTGPAPTVAEVTTDDPGKVNALLTESARFTRYSNYLGTPALTAR